ncbi:MAG: hypothetical protein ABUL65_03895 [Opitutus sp.]
MQPRLASSLLAAALLLTGARAEDAPQAPAKRPTLAIIVIDNAPDRRNSTTEFDRIDLAFQYVAKQRKWPVAIAAEPLTDKTQLHPLELRFFHQGLREEIGNEFIFRAHLTLVVGDAKQDLGLVSYRYTARQWENNEAVQDKVFRGAAFAAADKLEPIIFARAPARPASPGAAPDKK